MAQARSLNNVESDCPKPKGNPKVFGEGLIAEPKNVTPAEEFGLEDYAPLLKRRRSGSPGCVSVSASDLAIYEKEIVSLAVLTNILQTQPPEKHGPIWRFLCAALVKEAKGGHFHRAVIRMLEKSYDNQVPQESVLMHDNGFIPKRLCDLCYGHLEPLKWLDVKSQEHFFIIEILSFICLCMGVWN